MPRRIILALAVAALLLTGWTSAGTGSAASILAAGTTAASGQGSSRSSSPASMPPEASADLAGALGADSPYALVVSGSDLSVGGDFTDAARILTADFVAKWGLGGVTVVRMPDGRIRLGTGAFIGDDIYNTTGTGQSRTGSATPGHSVTFGISIQNDGTNADRIKVKATGTTSSTYTVQYYRGTTEITSAVVAGTYTTTSLAPAATYLITAKVTVKSTAPVGSKVTRLVTLTSVGDGAQKDAVVFVGKRTPPVITAISAGGGYTCVRTSDGAAWCWGDNSSGQLGDGTTTQRLHGVRVTKAGGSNLAGVTSVSAGGRGSTCARTSDGAAWCWGDNASGQLGDGTTTDRHRAVRVTKAGGGYLTGVTSISTNGYTISSFGWIRFTTCARTSDGAAWCWGNNSSGHLGDGTTTNRHRAVRVTKAGGGYLTGVTRISTGLDSSCASTSGGTAWCWGNNAYGQLGDGTTTNRHRAVPVTKAGGGTLTGVSVISSGGFSNCASTSGGAAWCWGSNYFGELGDGSTTDRHRAVRATKSGAGSLTGVTTISAVSVAAEDVPSGHACARTGDGTAWCWGDNYAGALGDGTTAEAHGAVQVTMTGGGNLSGVTAISAGLSDTCAMTTGGAAWCWGGNYSGELGDGTTTERDEAVRVTAH